MIKKSKINTQQFLKNNQKIQHSVNFNLSVPTSINQSKLINSGKKKFREFVLDEKLAYTFFVTRHNNGNYYYAKTSFLKVFNFKKLRFLKLKKLQRIAKIKSIAKQNILNYNLYRFLPRRLSIFLFNNQEDYLDQKLINLQNLNNTNQLILLKKKHPLKSAVTSYYKVYPMYSSLYFLFRKNSTPRSYNQVLFSAQIKANFFYEYTNVLLFNTLK